eukprot:1150756-Pelagomonas_calceolata.AAC.2
MRQASTQQKGGLARISSRHDSAASGESKHPAIGMPHRHAAWYLSHPFKQKIRIHLTATGSCKAAITT